MPVIRIQITNYFRFPLMKTLKTVGLAAYHALSPLWRKSAEHLCADEVGGAHGRPPLRTAAGINKVDILPFPVERSCYFVAAAILD